MNTAWLTIPEAAAKGPLSQVCLRKMRDLGTLPCIRIGRKTLVHYPRLLEQLEKQQIGTDITSRK